MAAPELRERFRKAIRAVEEPLARFQAELGADDKLLRADRASLAERVARLGQRLDQALDLDKVPPEARRELFALLIQPDSPDALDDLDDKIIDRLLGHAVGTANVEDMVAYVQIMDAGRYSAEDPRYGELLEVLTAIREQAESLPPS